MCPACSDADTAHSAEIVSVFLVELPSTLEVIDGTSSDPCQLELFEDDSHAGWSATFGSGSYDAAAISGSSGCVGGALSALVGVGWLHLLSFPFTRPYCNDERVGMLMQIR